VAIAAHPLESFDDADKECLPPIHSSLLVGVPVCPYCENSSVCMCGCGALFCTRPDLSDQLICPSCNAVLTRGESGGFEVFRSEG
jgi:hypothetical protein